MPRNGSGTYNLPTNSWNPAINGVQATAADWQTLIDDVGTALTGSVSADGQTTMTGNLPMGGNTLTNVGAPTGNGQPLRWEQMVKGADIASASTIAIPNEGNLFDVTGTTNITGFSGGFPGRIVCLRFISVLTMNNSASFKMPGAANLAVDAGTVCTFVCSSSGVWELISYAVAASQTQVDVGANDNRYVTPLKLRNGFSANLASSGHIKLPSWLGGFQVCWGNPTTTGTGGIAVSFSRAFSTAPFCVVATANIAGISPITITASASASVGTFFASNPSSAGVPSAAFFYVAFGSG